MSASTHPSIQILTEDEDLLKRVVALALTSILHDVRPGRATFQQIGDRPQWFRNMERTYSGMTVVAEIRK